MSEKVKRTRAKKQSTATDLMATIQPQSLETKVELIGLLTESIETERKLLEEKLKLISTVK